MSGPLLYEIDSFQDKVRVSCMRARCHWNYTRKCIGIQQAINVTESHDEHHEYFDHRPIHIESDHDSET